MTTIITSGIEFSLSNGYLAENRGRLQEVHTKASYEEALRALDLPGEVVDLLAKEQAHDRHCARVVAAIDLAARVARDQAGDQWVEERWRSFALAVLLADAVGVGGRGDCEGKATDRYPGFYPGSGRKQAADGAAWSAARDSAIRFLLREEAALLREEQGWATDPVPEWRADGHRADNEPVLWFTWQPVSEPDGTPPVYTWCHWLDPRWGLSLAREFLRRAVAVKLASPANAGAAAREAAWHPDLPVRGDHWPTDWADLVVRLQRDATTLAELAPVAAPVAALASQSNTELAG